MANRQTVKSNITSKIQPLMTTIKHRDVLLNDMSDNLVFGEDVAVLQASGATNITVDFVGKDRVDLTRTGGALNISVSGIGDGETKFLLISKTSGQAITFAGVTDVTPVKANVSAISTVLYEIVRKSSFFFAKAWVETIKSATTTIEGVQENATATEANALSATNKTMTPGTIPIASTSQRGVQENATTTEANALSSTTRTVTPGTIPKASTAQKGVIEVATPAQNDAGIVGNLAVIASELKRKYDALVSLINAKTSLVFSGSTAAPFSLTFIFGRKNGAVRTVHCQVSASAITGLKFIRHIDGYVSPGGIVPFVATNDSEIVDEGGGGYIDTLGDIYMQVGATGIWRFTAVVIS